MLASVGNPPVQMVLWDGQQVGNTSPGGVGRLLVRDRSALLHLIADPEFRFGELYVSQRIEVEGDLTDFLEALYRAVPRNKPPGLKERLLAPFGMRRNPPDKAASNIYHHYDIGNDFYRLWLDGQMVYTCAYYPTPDFSLEQAQEAKLEYVCRKLMLKPGETVVEAGCGWGALSLHMARHYGVKVRAYNLSKQQIAYAREAAQAEGLVEAARAVIATKPDAELAASARHVGLPRLGAGDIAAHKTGDAQTASAFRGGQSMDGFAAKVDLDSADLVAVLVLAEGGEGLVEDLDGHWLGLRWLMS
jgi:cyclopropane-fatty-acyl-phospholipid synthase